MVYYELWFCDLQGIVFKRIVEEVSFLTIYSIQKELFLCFSFIAVETICFLVCLFSHSVGISLLMFLLSVFLLPISVVSE